MPAFTWTARRRLAAGSTLGDVNSLDIADAPNLMPQPHRRGTPHESLDLTQQYVLTAIQERWDVTVIVPNGQRELWREFVASVAGGEEFTFDAFGTIAAPDDPLAVKLHAGGDLPNQARGWEQQTADYHVSMVLDVQGLIT